MNGVSYFHNVISPVVVKNISIEEWFEMIKKSDFSDLIASARIGGMKYDFVKKNMLPAITYNFQYNSYKNDKNIACSTGFLYIDIDKPEFDPQTLDMDKICAIYKSLGGQGYGLVVRVEELSLENFKKTYLGISEELGITQYVDKGAIKASQYNILSFDPEIKVNMNSKIFPIIDDNFDPPSSEKKRKKHIYNDGGSKETVSGDSPCEFKPLRFTNAQDHVSGDEKFITDFEGYDEVKCWVPPRRKKTGRNLLLLSYTNNLVWLNPHVSQCRVMDVLSAVNMQAFVDPVDADHMKRVVDTIFGYKANGTLVPFVSEKKRKIIFAENSKMSREEKNGLVIKTIADMRRQTSIEKLRQIIFGWNHEKHGKITQRKISANNEISHKTVQKYWSELEDILAPVSDSQTLKQVA